MKIRVAKITVIGRGIRACALSVSVVLASNPLRGESLDLLTAMTALQGYTHKVQLSLDKENLPLAEFYVGELAGLIAAVAEVESYGDYPVGALAKTALKGPYSHLARSVADADIAAADKALDELIEACNSCHELTEHDYLVIERNANNPYLQNFIPR